MEVLILHQKTQWGSNHLLTSISLRFATFDTILSLLLPTTTTIINSTLSHNTEDDLIGSTLLAMMLQLLESLNHVKVGALAKKRQPQEGQRRLQLQARPTSAAIKSKLPPAEYLFRYGFWVRISSFDYFKLPLDRYMR
jgi:hypothetical protein